ncbi:hypothetical protein E4U25_003650 [Claviceps purpurea]|nr:hypothetical protein E4U25_003650 [Claviceps purpurea]
MPLRKRRWKRDTGCMKYSDWDLKATMMRKISSASTTSRRHRKEAMEMSGNRGKEHMSCPASVWTQNSDEPMCLWPSDANRPALLLAAKAAGYRENESWQLSLCLQFSHVVRPVGLTTAQNPALATARPE